jgi:pimeloyl-ACP methyl ester carboxylesterase
MPSTLPNRSPQTVTTPSGSIAYRESGAGRPAVFLHGAFLNGYQWRHQLDALGDLRRCLAPDLLSHGHTQIAAGQEVSYPAQAGMLAEFCDALGLGEIDLIGNDSGGGIAQIFTATHPQRVRSLTLTDCEVHDNWPPAGGQAIIDAAAAGQLGPALHAMLDDPAMARSEQGIGVGYAHPERLTENTITTYLAPLVATPDTVRNLERFFLAFDNTQSTTIESQLRALTTPTLIVWGADDAMFHPRWADWLAETIPGARPPIKIDGAKMFHPEEFPDTLSDALRRHWSQPR